MTWIAARATALVADLVTADEAAAARAALADRWRRFVGIDRGSYEFADEPSLPELLDRVTAAAANALRTPLTLRSARALRLVAGDYLLAHHDAGHDDLQVEAMLDLSPSVVPGAEVRYRRRGDVVWIAPSQPGSLAVVERGPTTSSDHAYISRRWRDAEIVRVVLRLGPVP